MVLGSVVPSNRVRYPCTLVGFIGRFLQHRCRGSVFHWARNNTICSCSKSLPDNSARYLIANESRDNLAVRECSVHMVTGINDASSNPGWTAEPTLDRIKLLKISWPLCVLNLSLDVQTMLLMPLPNGLFVVILKGLFP
ncbi:hypothetical protein CASFOL_009025 [Castilleja foliolosa]|uniref:Uncharacterized protein n=1 Tax=Castilleja foliolosa TaxID=1961234 RepID=A0ABD3E157_9LAMI